MIGKWTRWDPLDELNCEYCITSIKDDINGLEIIFTHIEEKKSDAKIIFHSGSVESYRVCDEHCRLELLRKLKEKYGGEFYAKWNYFKVVDSEYLKWLSKESDTITDYLEVQHYVLMDQDIVLDVVATVEPKIEVIKSK